MIPALANHLWQSTLFAAVAALLTLTLRKNRAQTRRRVWLAASMKFLVPFSLLVALGGHLNWHAPPVAAQPRLAFALEELSQPFVAPMVSAPAAAATETGLSPLRIVAIVWACGVLAVLCHWLFRWFGIKAVLRSSAPLRLEFPVPVRTSASLIEPGIFGILRPILLLPEGIAERLAPEQLRAILAHELSHVHRRDNLTGFIHMLVEAAFWFPYILWCGCRDTIGG
jgi:beta-lactamase regulating signal transducer with metallopeptidase domain